MSLDVAAAGRTLTHQLLDKGPVVSTLKSWVSGAVLDMVASSAGLMTYFSGDRDQVKVDATIVSGHDYTGQMLHPELSVQLKCTSRPELQMPDHILWDIDKATSTILASPFRQKMAILCVVAIPSEPGHWVSSSDDATLAHCKPYFIRGSDIGGCPDGQARHRLHIPHSNLLTPKTLLGLMAEAATWRLGNVP